jgi:hypothetical protein
MLSPGELPRRTPTSSKEAFFSLNSLFDVPEKSGQFQIDDLIPWHDITL